MSATVYQTQPGTIPHRAIALLTQLGPSVKLSTAELAEAIGSQVAGFSTCMRPAREAGLVIASYKQDNKNVQYWSLSEGVPDKPAATLKDYSPPAEPRARQKPGPKPKAPTEPRASRHFMAGLFTDGTMRVEIGSNTFVTDPAETADIRRLLMGQP